MHAASIRGQRVTAQIAAVLLIFVSITSASTVQPYEDWLLMQRSAPQQAGLAGLLDVDRANWPETQARALLEQADRAFEAGDLLLAVIYMEQACERVPQRLTLKLALGELYNRVGKHEQAIKLAQHVLDKVPDSVQSHDILGTAHLRLDQIEVASEHYQRIIVKAPAFSLGYLRMAGLHVRTNEPGIALAFIEQTLQRAPRDIEAMALKAIVLLELGEHLAALQAARLLIERNDHDAFAYSLAGDAATALRRYDDAKQAYERAITLQPAFAHFHFQLATLHESQQQTDVALAAYQQAVALQGGHVAAHAALARLYADRGQQALHHYHLALHARARGMDLPMIENLRLALHHDPAMGNALRLLARIHLDRGDLAQAQALAQKAIAAAADDAPAHGLLGQVSHRQGRYTQAREHYQRAIDADPLYAPAYEHLAALLFDIQELDDAKTLLHTGIGRFANHPGLRKRLGDVLDAGGDTDAAIAMYEQASRMNPHDPVMLNSLAWMLVLHERDVARGLALARKAAMLKPDAPDIRDTLGWAYHLLGQHDLALPELTFAVTALPDEPVVHYHLAAVLLHLDRADEALPHLRTSLDLGLREREASQARLMIERIMRK